MELKELLLNTGIELFSKKAYHSTGIREITKTANVPTGSFHYYFKNKEDFALAVLDYYYENNAREYSGLLFENKLTGKDKLLKLFSSMMNKYRTESIDNEYKGCLLGHFGQELSNESELITSKVKDLYDRMVHGIGTIIESGQKDKSINTKMDSKALAKFLFDAYEGLLIRRKVEKSEEPFDDFTRALEQI